MPTVSATPFPDSGHVLVQVVAPDDGVASCVQVRRVVDATGETTPLRPYVWPCAEAGEYLHLSGGQAWFWDTEAPLDVAFHYELTVLDALLSPLIVIDTFTRSVAGGWGTADTGQAYDFNADTSVTSNQGRLTHSAVNTFIEQHLNTSLGNFDLEITLDPIVSTGAGTGAYGIRARINTDAAGDDYVEFRVFDNPGSAYTVNMREVVNSVQTQFDPNFPSVPNVAAGGQIRIRLQVDGALARAKAWALGAAQPDAWMTQLTTVATTIPGRPAFNSSVPAGWTNVPPFSTIWDDLQISSLTETDATIAVSGSITLSSEGGFWLRDPVRPCNDVRLGLCFDDPECGANGGVFFADIGQQESYASNSVLALPTNARRPIALSRERRDASATLTVVSATFADRDAVKAVNQPGSPLQFVAPPAYGVEDRYMSVGGVLVSRGLPDHTFQPRLIQMPYDVVDRPVGPSEGVCGARFADQCDLYATWAAADATDLAWASLIIGTPGADGFRTWGQVNSTFANWTAVLAAGTWQVIRSA